VYSLTDYGEMIADRVRMDAYAYALKAAIGPDSVVLDLGTATGIHALLACKFGARQVYAIEPNETIHLARELAEANGFGDRIDFFHGLSTQVTLPERADIIVSDLRGVLPLFGTHIPSIIDARQRHLAPDGVLIPQQDTLWVSLVEARNVYKELVNPWRHPYGLDMEQAKQIALNRWSDGNAETIRRSNLLTEPQIWAILDYTSIEDPDVGRSNMILKATRDGTAHGLLIWFDAQIAQGIGFSNGPGADKLTDVYGRGFFPLLEPVSISEGDTINLSIRAELVNGEYVWRWHSRIHSQADGQDIKADFQQSTTFDGALSAELIAEGIKDDRPKLGQEGEVDLFILGKMDGGTTLEQIARHILRKYPTRFDDEREALIYVYELSQQYKQ
jgi:protein arginine N-methyltransferase 1